MSQGSVCRQWLFPKTYSIVFVAKVGDKQRASCYRLQSEVLPFLFLSSEIGL